MKRFLDCLAISAVAALYCGCSHTDIVSEVENPSADFRTAPFWVWNGNITKADIDASLTEYKKQGFGGVFLHPRMGMQNDYLSPEWFELCAYAVEKCSELGLNFWIYDEHSYPSGFAGGHVPEEMPESYNRGLGMKPAKLKVLPADFAKKYFAVLVRENGKYRDITNDAAKYVGKSGDFFTLEKSYIGKSDWFAGRNYVDLLAKGTTEKFLSITLDGYKKAFGDQFGKTVKGSFTDEPHINSYGGFKWTPDLFDSFKKKFGYDPLVNTPSLFENVGDWKKVRHDFHSVVLDLFADRWAKVYSQYCEKNNLQLTGHYWEHAWPSPSAGPDTMAMESYHQMPAIDMLFNRFNDESPNAQFGNVRSVREVASLANQLGRKRVLSETYGGAGWRLTFERMKLFADWQFATGISFVNQHVGHISMAGVRKYDYPPMFHPSAPWWCNYKPLNDYLARVSAIVSAGEEINEILVLEPTTSAWLYGTNKAGHIGWAFQKFITDMSKNQLEYDLLSEYVAAKHGSVADGKLVIGKRAYTRFAIPPETENIESSTFELLKKFVEQGGVVDAYARPTRLDGAESKELQSFFAKIPLRSEPIWKIAANKNVKFSNVAGGYPLHISRALPDGGTLVFVANVSEADSSKASISAFGNSAVLLDTRDGSVRKIPFETKDGRVSVNLDLKPVGSAAVMFSAEKAESPLRGAENFAEIPSSKISVSRVCDNVLCIPFVDMKSGGNNMKNAYFFAANDMAFSAAKVKGGNPWMQKMQFKKELVSRDFSNAPAPVVSYKFNVAPDANLRGLKILAERADLCEVSLNGKPLSILPEKTFDREFFLLDASNAVKTGENVFTMKFKKFSLDAEIEPVYVLGDFSVRDVGGVWTICAAAPLSLGGIDKQGLPFYPWEISYSKVCDISDLSAKYVLRAKDVLATSVSVWVNGKKCGVMFTRAEDFDLTPFLAKGENKIEIRTTGGMENFFGPFFVDTEEKGMTAPGFFRAKVENASPKDYRIRGYGLLSPFEVLKR